MKFFFKITALVFPILITFGCGGGSGSAPSTNQSGNSNTSSSSSSSSSGSSSASSSSSSSGGVGSASPTTEILFPIKNAQITEGTITLRGTATDDAGIQAVYVNEMAATIRSVIANSASAGTQKPNAQADEVSVEWEITLEVAYGDQVFEVVAEDSEGNLASEPNSVVIRRSGFPPGGVLDTANNRLIGTSSRFSSLALDLTNNSLSEIPGISKGSVIGISADGIKAYAIDEENHQLSLLSQDLDTGIESLERSSTFSFDDSTWESAFLWDHFFVESDNLIYLLYHMVPISTGETNPSREPHLYSWNISTGIISQIPLLVGEGSVPLIDRITWSGSSVIGLITPFVSDATENFVVGINPSEGTVTPIASGIEARANTIVVDKAGEFAYLAGYNAVVRVTLSTGEVQNISVDADQELFNFAQINNLVLDEERNQLLVGDVGLYETIKVNISTGERELLVSNGIGEGRKFIHPNELALDGNEEIVYALDDGDNGPELLFKIDLKTGDRTRLGQISDGINRSTTGLALDEANNRIFYSLGLDIYSMDLSTEDVVPISSDSEGTGVFLGGVWGIYFDHNADILLAVDSGQNLLVGINPETKNREIISFLTEGESPPVEIPVDVAVSADGETYYVYGQKQGALYSVDKASGARDVLLDECFNSEGKDLLPEDNGPQNMHFDSAKGKFLITGDNSIVEYDLAGDSCRVVSERMSVSDVLYKSDGIILASGGNSLLQFDSVNGDYVTLSK